MKERVNRLKVSLSTVTGGVGELVDAVADASRNIVDKLGDTTETILQRNLSGQLQELTEEAFDSAADYVDGIAEAVDQIVDELVFADDASARSFDSS